MSRVALILKRDGNYSSRQSTPVIMPKLAHVFPSGLPVLWLAGGGAEESLFYVNYNSGKYNFPG